jgi:cyanobactin maturation PatA/PatG family protease
MLVRAVRLCKDNNVLIVAATGNNGCDCLHVPAALDSVLAVGALNAEGVPLDSSNWGQAYQTQGILAPGENILGALPGGSTATRSGTSFATPIVVGIAALLLSIQEQRGEKPDPQAVRAAILNSAFPCPPETVDDTRRCLVGKLNIAGAHRLIVQGEPKEMSEKKLDIKPSQVDNLDQENEQEELYPLQEPSGVLPGNGGVQVAQATRYPSSRTSTIKPSGNCGCNGGRVTPSMQSNTVFSLIYAIGTLGYDFGTEARRDSFKQQMAEVRSDNYQPTPDNEDLPPGD